MTQTSPATYLFALKLESVDENPLRSLLQIRRLVLLAFAPTSSRFLLDLGCLPIKHKHGLDAVEQQLRDAMEGTDQVRILDHIAFVVAHHLDKLREPDARVHSEHFGGERLDLDLPPHRREEHPQILDAHGDSLTH